MSRTGEKIPTVMPTDNRPINEGKTLNDETSRLEGVAKVTGAARYSSDMYLPNSLFVGFVRCPYGAADLTSTDEEAALAMPGVLEVRIHSKEGVYHGASAGYVVAESPQALRRGLRALNPTWKWKDVKTAITDEIGDPLEPDNAMRKLLEKADHVLEAVYSTQVQTHSSAETHGAVVDHRGDSAVMYASTQGTFAARDGMEDHFGLPLSKIEVRCEHIGGGFGSKLGPGKENATAARVAAKYQRPVYLFVTREEEHLDTGNRPSSLVFAKIGFKRDGTILGGQLQTYGGVGVAGGGGGTGVPSGSYDLGDIKKQHQDVRFNAGAPRPFRAPGRPQGSFTEELILDEVATIAGVDPLDLRIQLETSDDRREMLRMGADLIGWKNRTKTGSQRGVVRRGFGIGASSWGRYPARTEAEVVINRDGSVEARTGTQDIGTGQRTAMAVVVSNQLHIPLEHVEVRIGSSTLPIGPASGGSMTVHNTAPAMMMAADEAMAKLLTTVADRVGLNVADLRIDDGHVVSSGDTLMTWSEACSRMAGENVIGRGNRGQGVEKYGGEGHSQGVQFVDLQVDAETGVIRVSRVVAVQACGTVVCRKTAENQIMGGVMQGIGYALFEDRILDRNVGAMINANLSMYKTPTTADMPRIEPVFYTKGQTGTRSLGEPPTIPTAGAIACAVFNAIGAPVRDLPITPDKVLTALEGGAG